MRLPIISITLALFLIGCSSTTTTPLPTETFTAMATYLKPHGAEELATVEARKFCKHWKAVPGFLEKKTTEHNGNYTTTITYKCY